MTPTGPIPEKGSEEAKITKRWIGLSRDGRTNAWELTCPCGKRWKPRTTMLALSFEECPKCEKGQVVNYNEYTP